jgi:hypothetical protein
VAYASRARSCRRPDASDGAGTAGINFPARSFATIVFTDAPRLILELPQQVDVFNRQRLA